MATRTSEFRRFSSIPPKKYATKTGARKVATNDDGQPQENDPPKLPPLVNQRKDNVTRISAKTDGHIGRYIRRPIQKPGRRDIPVSIESEYRAVVTTANQSTSELRTFKRKYKTDDIDFQKVKETAKDIVRQINLQEDEIERADEFRKLLATRKLGQEIQNRPEIEDLELLSDKAGKFEEMMPDIMGKLTASITKHLAKYCLSFIEEAKGVNIKIITEHEEAIKNHNNVLDEKLKEISESYEKYSNSSVPFINGYLENAEDLIKTMEECVSKAISVGDTMKKWVKLDKAYPIKLWDEITHDNHERNKKQDDIKKIRLNKEEQHKTLHRKEIIRDKAAAKYSEAKIEKRKLKTHKDNLEKRVEQTQTELDDKKSELAEVSHEYNNRKYNSPKYVDRLWNKMEFLEMNVFKLEERFVMLKRQQERYDKLDGELEDKVSEYEYDVMGKQSDVDDVKSKIKSCEQDSAQLIKEIKSTETKIAVCKHVREMKLSAAILRKIYFQKLDSTSQDILMEVCKVVASNIGREWEALYMDLLFTPPRSKEKREKDLEYIKLNSVRREITGQKLAWQGLQKWRIFNKNGTVPQLLRSLRRLEKFALAHKVEHMHKKSNTANS